MGAVGAIAPTVFYKNPIDAEDLHPQIKSKVEVKASDTSTIYHREIEACVRHYMYFAFR